MPDPYSPPPGWTIANGILTPDRSVRGYLARDQDVKGRCAQRDCRRTCHVDHARLHEQGLGALKIDQVKRLLRCARLDTCALEFHEDLTAESLKLGDLTRRPAVSLRILCRGCGASRAVSPRAMIAKLTSTGKGDGATETRDIARLLTAPCKACGKVTWAVDVLWPDPKTIGGKRQIHAATVGTLPKDGLEFWEKSMNQIVPPAPESFGYVTRGSFGGATRIYRDGAAFVADHGELPGGFWDRLPLVLKHEPAQPQTAAAATRVWLSSVEREVDGAPELPFKLDRPHDAVISGWFDPGPDIWSAHPDVEAAEYVWSDGGDGFPDSWHVTLWLKAR